jgi:hypothetical protein
LIDYSFKGFTLGVEAGLAVGYLATGSRYRQDEWRTLVVGMGVGAFAGITAGIFIAAADYSSRGSSVGYYILRDTNYGTLIGAAMGAVVGGLVWMDDGLPRDLLRGTAYGMLFGGVAGITYGLIEWGHPLAALAGVIGVVTAVAFLGVERRGRHPMMPLGLFGDRTFSAANSMTLLVYAALGAVLFFLVLQLQTVSGYGALEAGLATLPITICMLLFASRGGALAQRIGPRIPMTVGPIVMGVASLMLLGVGEDVNYWRDVLPGLTLFGLGLALMVAPLTATVLAAAPDENAGIASGINNAVARAGSLLAIAALPVAVGLGGDDYTDPAVFDSAYHSATLICAVLLVLGGVLSWFTIPASLKEAASDSSAV